jgi:hypothetical protein
MKPLKLKLRVKWEKWVEGVIIEERIVEKKPWKRKREQIERKLCFFIYLFIFIII